jgi:hypothetical protein
VFATVASVRLGGRDLPFVIERIEKSRYVVFRLASLPRSPIVSVR